MTNHEDLKDLKESIIILTSKIDNFKEDQLEIKEGVSKIKEAVYNPDNGIYARIRSLESFKGVTTRFMWIVLTGIVGLLTSAIVMQIIDK